MYGRKLERQRQINELYKFMFLERATNKLQPLYEDYEII